MFECGRGGTVKGVGWKGWRGGGDGGREGVEGGREGMEGGR